MTNSYQDQRDVALNERIVRIINGSKKFIVCTTDIDNMYIAVEIQQVQVPQSNSEIMDWIRTTTKYVYNNYRNDPGRMMHLYAALAYKFVDMDINISELDSGGSGTTIHFNSTRPSQVIKI